MASWLRQLDELLRGDRAGSETLASEASSTRSRVLLGIAVVAGCTYGFFMGWYAVSMGGWKGLAQMASTTLKLPLLFLLTLAVTFPSLYVFNALVGCRLGCRETMRVLLGAIVVNLAVGASLGPILGFFTVSTTSYPFMVLLNVVLLGIAGLVGLGFLMRMLNRIAESQAEAELTASDAGMRSTPEAGAEVGEPAPAVPRRFAFLDTDTRRLSVRKERAGMKIFAIWVVIYALVGTQMGWVLRPFIGTPGATFTLLRERQGSFFSGFFGSLRSIVESQSR